MRTLLITAVTAICLAGCVVTGPVIEKSKMGNLEINVYDSEGKQVHRADLYLDDTFIGNVTESMPIIHARNGQRIVRVEASGFKHYERTIVILGEPNHQVLNVFLEKR